MPEILRNPEAGTLDRTAISSTRQPLEFHRRLPGYEPTPLVDSPDLARTLGVGRVLVKVEAERFGLPAFKMLGASWAAYRALVSRLGTVPEWSTLDDLAAAVQALQPLTLLAATDGNHGRAVARMARLLGFGSRIFVPEGTAVARIEAIASEGADVVVVDGSYDDAVRRSATEADDRHMVISDTSWPGYTDPPRHVIEGYSTIFWEVEDALRSAGLRAPDAVFVPVGVGALAAAAVSHYRQAEQNGAGPAVISVEPVDAACVLESIRAHERVVVPGPHRSIMAGLNCGEASLIAWPVVSRGLAWCVAVDDDAARAAMRAFAAIGIVAGETAAASLAGAVEFLTGPAAPQRRGAARLDRDATILLLSTEGATDPQHYESVVGTEPSLVGPPPAERLVGTC